MLLTNNDGTLSLSSGDILVCGEHPLEIAAQLHDSKGKENSIAGPITVHASKGCVASISCHSGSAAVRSCSRVGAISVSAGGKRFSLGPGEEILVTTEKPTAAQSNPPDGLGRRGTRTGSAGQCYITRSEFSIVSLLVQLPITNSESISNKQLFNQVMKTAATVDVALKYKGPYTMGD